MVLPIFFRTLYLSSELLCVLGIYCVLFKFVSICTGCSCIAALFQKEVSSSQVQLHFDFDIINSCIRYLYTQEVNIIGENVQDILEFANYINLKSLVNISSSYIIDNIDESNVGQVILLADTIGNETMLEAAVVVIATNIQKVLHTDDLLQMLPERLFKRSVSSDKVILYSNVGTILPGIEREVAIIPIIEHFLQANNIESKKKMPEYLPFLRLKSESNKQMSL